MQEVSQPSSSGARRELNSNGFLQELAGIVGEENLFHSKRDKLAYEYDATPEASEPLAIVFPRTTSQVAEIVRASGRSGVPLVARGAGTNLSGGTVPLEQGLVVTFTRMDSVLEMDLASERAVVQPGVVNLDLQQMLAADGYVFAPDPSSQKISTLGGNVGENAGGPRCLKYGVTTNHVCGLQVILADGEVIETGGAAEDTPGYDLTGLLVGSEGTFGVVTAMTLRLMRTTEETQTMLAIFNALEDAGQAVSDIIAAGLVPATLEIMDGTTVRAVEASGARAGYPPEAEAVLIIELDGLRDGQNRQAERIVELCRRNRVRDVQVARNKAEREQMWSGRRAAYSALVGISPGSLVHDLTVPRTRLAEALRGVAEIGDRLGLRVGGAAHAGDGNLHPVVMVNTNDPEEVERGHQANRAIIELCVRLGGTITGEHGIGMEKIAFMPLLYGDAELDLMRLIKRAFDPEGRLNPGKLLPAGR